MVELNDHGPLDKRCRGNHPGSALGGFGQILPAVNEPVVGQEQVGVEPDHLPLEFPLETGHD